MRKREKLTSRICLLGYLDGFPGGTVIKTVVNAGDARDMGFTDSMDMSLSKLLEILKDREAWCVAAHWVTKSCTPLSNRAPTSSTFNMDRKTTWEMKKEIKHLNNTVN